MITTVKNKFGYSVSSLIFLCSVVLLALTGFYGLSSNISKEWFVLTGLLVSVLVVSHQAYMVINRFSYTRRNFTHAAAMAFYSISLVCCIIIPVYFSEKYSLLSSADQGRARTLFWFYGMDVVLISVIFVALFFNKNQLVQAYLHPFSEIIDGYSKSVGSIQMHNLNSGSLKQVIVDGGGGDLKEEGDDSDSEKGAGKSKLSKVLKTWPKADPFPVKALYSFKTGESSELPFKKGDTLKVLDCRGRWWQAEKNGAIGFIPSNYVAVLRKAKVVSSYSATGEDEVSVRKGQTIEVMETFEEKSLIRTVNDKIGAIPTDRLEMASDEVEEDAKENVNSAVNK